MMKSAKRCLVVLAVVIGGCASTHSPGLSRAQVEDISMLQYMFMDSHGYNYYIDLRDVDSNGELDIYLEYKSGPRTESVDTRLANTASTLAMIMAGCGYDIDKVCVIMDGAEYRTEFKPLAKCVWGERGKEPAEGETPEEKDCFTGIWQKME